MELPLKKKLFYFFPVLFCFCLPFGSLLLSGLIVLWTLVSFFNIEVAQLKAGLKNRNLHAFYAFFLLTLASAALSENKVEALFGIEIKISFVLFPYFIFCFKWHYEILRRCVISFVSGCFFACLYLIARACIYAYWGDTGYFFYTLFSDFIHASSFAMYLILAITFVVLFYETWFKTQKSIIYSSYFFISIFVTSIFLCSSKLGLISFFICMPVLLMYKRKIPFNFKTAGIAVACIALLVFAASRLFPNSFGRLNSIRTISIGNLDKTSSESTTVRLLIWKESAGIIRNNLIFGTGVGDANDDLYHAYEAGGLTGALEHRLNAHNQFLQTFIGMGVIGILFLLFLTFGQLIKAFILKNFLLFIFFLLIILNFMVESMLQRSDGVLFFAFFYCFLNLVNEKKLAGD